jgi:glucose-6-phosphate 1-epimerase
MDIAQANDEFGIDGILQYLRRRRRFAADHDRQRARPRRDLCLCRAGAVVSAGRSPHDLLFVSEHAYLSQPGKAIKGGIPVCWPWFGPDPRAGSTGPRLRARAAVAAAGDRVHGRRRDPGAARLPRRRGQTRALWPHPFALEIEVTVGATLEVALITRNTGDAPVTLTQALHTYFKVGDVRQAQVLGLAGHDYIDKVAGAETAERTQSGPINFDGPVNRIYLDTAERLTSMTRPGPADPDRARGQPIRRGLEPLDRAVPADGRLRRRGVSAHGLCRDHQRGERRVTSRPARATAWRQPLRDRARLRPCRAGQSGGVAPGASGSNGWTGPRSMASRCRRCRLPAGACSGSGRRANSPRVTARVAPRRSRRCSPTARCAAPRRTARWSASAHASERWRTARRRRR